MNQLENREITDQERIRLTLTNLEKRMGRLESYLGLTAEAAAIDAEKSSAQSPASSFHSSEYGENSMEMTIGEIGLAWVGSFIFLLGIGFLMTYTLNRGYPIPGILLGYLAAVGLYYAARMWKESIPHLSPITVGGSLLLLFYTTIRLHYFTAEPLLRNRYAAGFALLAVVAFQLHLAWRSNSQSITGMAVLLGMVTALLIDQTHLTLPLVAAGSALSAFLMIRRGWWKIAALGIGLAYGAHLLWLINNPIAGHSLKGVAEHQYNILYLFCYATIFFLSILFQREWESSHIVPLTLILLNCSGFSLVTFLTVLTHYSAQYATVYLGVAGLFLAISIFHWWKTHEWIASSVYACLGFMALSIAIYGSSSPPTSFLWLTLQSLLVLSMALWFRSRILVVVNTLIFVSILLAYLATSPSSHWVNFCLVLVAHTSARVMNWRKERLTLRTEALRNIYLFLAFVMVLVAIYRISPIQYVTLAWALAGIAYFMVSYLLRNIKYRLMAMGVMTVTVLYLFLVDLARLAPEYRVAAFLFLGMIVLVISLFYTRIRRVLKNTA